MLSTALEVVTATMQEKVKTMTCNAAQTSRSMTPLDTICPAVSLPV